jgi:hypothetical protein
VYVELAPAFLYTFSSGQSLSVFLPVARLPDGFFSDQKSQSEYILESLGMENVDIYSGNLEYYTTIGYI